jgi:hypothetical protein
MNIYLSTGPACASFNNLTYGSPEMRCPKDIKSKDNGRLYKIHGRWWGEQVWHLPSLRFEKKSIFIKENTSNIKTKN